MDDDDGSFDDRSPLASDDHAPLPTIATQHEIDVADTGPERFSSNRVLARERESRAIIRNERSRAVALDAQARTFEAGEEAVDSGEIRERRRGGHVGDREAPRPLPAGNSGVGGELKRGAETVFPMKRPRGFGAEDAVHAGYFAIADLAAPRVRA